MSGKRKFHLLTVLSGLLLVQILAQTVQAAAERIAPPLATITAGYTPSEEDKKAGSVALLNYFLVSSDGKGNLDSKEYIAVKILNKSAADDYSQISIRFNSYYSDMRLDFARLITADGKVFNVERDAMKIEDVAENYIFGERKQLTFSLPAIAENTIIEYQLSRKTVRQTMDQYWMKQPFFHHFHYSIAKQSLSVERTRKSQIVLEMPESEYFKYKIVNAGDVVQTKKLPGQRIRRSWTLTNLPKLKLEDGMQTFDKLLPYLDMSTIKSWQDVDKWAAQIYEPVLKPDKKLRALAAEIVKGKKTRKEKIKAVYKYMQDNVRYVGAHLNRGGYTPHQPGIVLKNRYGDCKDQTVLIVSLLRAAGINARPAILRTFPEMEVDKHIPTMQFSHMITYIPDEDIWMDTSGSEAQFPGIHTTLETRTAFVIDGKGGQLQQIPASAAALNNAVVTNRYHYVGDDIVQSVTFVLYGAVGNYWRGYLNSLSEPEKGVKKFIKDVYNDGEIKNIKYSDHKDVSKPLTINLDVVYKNAYNENKKLLKYHTNVFFVAKLFSSVNELIKQTERVHDYQYGLSFTVSLKNIYDLPSASYAVKFDNKALEHNSKWIKTTHSHTIAADKAVVSSKYVFTDHLVRLAEFEKFRKSIVQAINKSQWDLQLVYDKTRTARNEIKNKLRKNPLDLKAMAELAEHHIDMGEYEKSLAVSRKIIKLDAKNGRAYYIMGIALGMLDRYAESEKALLKSEKLGYAP
ncbi:MAG: DUF3857 domain-containing protein [Gammaproteobacteria bacterium]|nr:DUF3857 domain-containing protein [Gammaproteobacteria bacterium]MDH5650583.1 DUF3857 domain-containing protein [Gammaproteobacteria bacterium]